MSKLETIPGIGKSSVELLEAAGFLDENSLAKAGLDQLVAELERANSVLKIAKRAPRRAEVEKWLSAARDRTGIAAPGSDEEDEGAQPLVAVNYEENPEVAAMLARSPSAQPLPPRLLIENELAVSDIPPAVLLSRVVGDLDVRVTETASSKPVKLPAGGSVQVGDAPAPKREIDASRIRTIADMTPVALKPGTSSSDSGNDRVALIRAPRESTNRGRNPESRFFIRGVLHTHPLQVMFGAVVTLVMMVVLPLAIVAAGLLLLSDMQPEQFGWVPKWFLAFPIALPVTGLAYLIWGVGAGKCRICGQRLFVPKNCRKNAKAHHVKWIGYIIPTALHMLFFRWFRCTYCGTPVRLKE
ncbi:DUF4332 domain-containing protein [Luteolibacter sp. LG18]|uniref:DUF4332 domain-containing protein n=1 Tax=Luteolibacter sp. LG18 TaxID=2819286 RepID=UPI002B2FADFF|nr:hypothetical protein llg_45370 [Luteolibacter sp. LG18]